ncbi:MAG: type II secretion system protein GspG [Nitrospira sp.]|nr:type II secretion system protein GspG [Nitrospira sp.]
MTTTAGTWSDNRILTLAAVALLGLGAVFSVHTLDKQRETIGTSASLSYLPKGEYLKLAVLGYRHIVADAIWLKAVQGLSGRQQTRDGYIGAYHAADVVTDLDPQFIHAYQYTGTVLGVFGGLPEESVALLKKGIHHNPTVWQLSFFLGYDYFYELQDPVSAAKYFRAASLLPDAPDWLAGLAVRMAAEANDLGAALEFLHRLYLQTTDEQMKEGLVRRIREVTAERDIRILEQAVNTYQARMGKLPKTLDELVVSGILTTVPPDPFGGPYQFSPSKGTVWSTGLPERLHVYRQ